MTSFEDKIAAYKKQIQKKDVRDEAVVKAVRSIQEMMTKKNDEPTSYLAFLYQQSRYIQKKWWLFQGVALVFFWFLIANNAGSSYSQRILGVAVSVFVVFIIPELWKNRRTSSMEIEWASFYSLRQIYAARFLALGLVDVLLMTMFFIFTLPIMKMSLLIFVVNFLLPFNVTCCICFRFLCSQRNDSEYIALIFCMIWIIVWTFIVSNDVIYHAISLPLWCIILGFSFIYLIYCIRKSNLCCQLRWEESKSWG